MNRSADEIRLEWAEAMCLAKMSQWGLTAKGWRFVWSRHKTTAGMCDPGNKTIELSTYLTVHHSEEAVLDTILHEIAHALAFMRYGRNVGHSRRWRDIATSIGASGDRTWDTENFEDAEAPPTPWVGKCVKCGKIHTRHQQPTAIRGCTDCQTAKPGLAPVQFWERRIEWEFHGRQLPMSQMHPKYRYSYMQAEARYHGAVAQGPRPTAADPEAWAESGGTAGILARPLPAPAERLRIGEVGEIDNPRDRFHGVQGKVEKIGRTRYHIRTDLGLVTVPFRILKRVQL